MIELGGGVSLPLAERRAETHPPSGASFRPAQHRPRVGRTVVCAGLALFVLAGCSGPWSSVMQRERSRSRPLAPKIERLHAFVPEAAYGPGGENLEPLRLVAWLRLRAPYEGYSLFISDVRVEHREGMWGRCQTSYVARTETLGKDGAILGGPLICRLGAVRPSWDPLELEQVSCNDDAQLTAGTVDADVSAVRFHFSSGPSATYKVEGPLLPHAASRRVFLLDQGARFWLRAEALRGGRVVASQRGSAPSCD